MTWIQLANVGSSVEVFRLAGLLSSSPAREPKPTSSGMCVAGRSVCPNVGQKPQENRMAKSQSEQMNAIELLKADHKKVQDLFKKFDKVKDDEEASAEIIRTACMELQIHDQLETEIFYPAIEAQADEDELEDLLGEAQVEHETVRELIEKLQGGEGDSRQQHAQFRVLMEYVKHHVKEEEQEMFPQLKSMKSLDLQALGQEMSQRKTELTSEMGAEEAMT
jgi:hemerythrin superfamily protein